MQFKEKEIPNGQVGIRDTLREMGIANERIGYREQDGMVTIDNRDFMKPAYMDEDAGVSYAPKTDIQKNFTRFSNGTDNPVVRVTDAYAASAGKYGLTGGGISFGNGTVSIGGKPISVLFLDNEGKSWAYRNDVDSAVEKYVENLGMQSPQSLAEQYEEKYLSAAENALNRLNRRKEFSYNPETDPVFEAYRKKYLQEGDRASRDAAASYAALTGGYVNSAAATAGAQAAQYYAQQIGNVIPELAKLAYDRYADQNQKDLDVVRESLDMYRAAYQTAADANNTLRDNANQSAEAMVARDDAEAKRQTDAWEKDWKERQNQQEFDINEEEREYRRQEQEDRRQDQEWENTFNRQKLTQNNLINAGLTLDNNQKQLYLNYYKSFLQAELQKTNSETALNQARASQIYAK